MTFGQKLKQARQNKNYTQKELANLIGAKHNSISNWENDQNKPDPDTIELICGVLEISANYLLGTEDPSKLLSNEALEIAQAYDKAEFEKQNIVRLTLGLELKKQSRLIKIPKNEEYFIVESQNHKQYVAEEQEEYGAAANANQEITQEELDEAVLQTLNASKKHKKK